MQGTTHSQTSEMHHQQIMYAAADNIYRCFPNLPQSFIAQFEISSQRFFSSWTIFVLKWNL